jgi:hypothetical protein
VPEALVITKKKKPLFLSAGNDWFPVYVLETVLSLVIGDIVCPLFNLFVILSRERVL